ncbi:hypothetical protein HHI36_018578 [Cryptolaemus montrouzieri]|uniref:Uncharacterized protein n=1 Tax=Cryptolaemus montrouzieri TaxID=559131 RepID=A0ABD2P0H5_9CUCU
MSQNITTTLIKASEEVARKKKRKNKISDETKEKIQERKQLYRLGQYATDRYRQTRNEARTMIRRNLEKHYRKFAENVIDKNKNHKCLRRKEEKQQIVFLKDESGRDIRNRNEIIEVTKQYYENLYNTQIERPRTSTDTKVLNVGSEDTLEINE